jgi:hypothetical protein
MRNYPSPTLAEYVQWLSETGTRVFLGSERMAWIEEGTKGVVARLPSHCTDVPTRSELNAVFSHNCFAAQYLIEPDGHHPANRWLYLADKTYDIQNLGRFARRDIRRAQRDLRITDLSWDEVRQHGEAAYCQTNARHDLPETTRDAFLDYVGIFAHNPAHHALGIWFGDRLIAFSTYILVDDWVDAVGLFLTDADRTQNPSAGLYHYYVERFIFNDSCRVVCVGLGGMIEDRRPGLHRFKLKTGYRIIPVHRAFSTPAWMRPLLNPATLFCAKAVLNVSPGNTRLRRAVRTLDEILHPRPLPAQGE